MQHLWDQGLVTLDPVTGRWTAALRQIEALGVTHNVGALLAAKLASLHEDCQRLLLYAACLGDSFTMQQLVTVTGLSLGDASEALWPAIETHLVLCQQASHHHGGAQGLGVRYRFAHDRVREATLASIVDASQLHAEIGTALWRAEPQPEGGALFDLVDHLNQAHAHALEQELRHAAGALNVRAGLQARRAAAFGPALHYLSCALQSGQLVEPARTEVEQHLADCEYISGRFAAAHARVQRLFDASRDGVARAHLRLRQARIDYAQGHMGDAADRAREGLALLGIRLAGKPAQLTVGMLLIRARRLMRGKSATDIANISPLHDTTDLVRNELLQFIALAAQISGRNELFAAAALHILIRTLSLGYTPSSAFSCSVGCVALVSGFSDLHNARTLRDAAEQMMARRGDQFPATSRVSLTAALDYLESTPAVLADRDIQVSQAALAQGDFPGLHASSAYTASLCYDFSLARCLAFCEQRRTLLQPNTDGLHAVQVYEQLVRALTGLTDSPWTLTDDHFDEEAFSRHLTDVPLHCLYSAKADLCLFHRDFEAGLVRVRILAATRVARGMGRTALGPTLALPLLFMQTQYAQQNQQRNLPFRSGARWALQCLRRCSTLGPRIFGGVHLLAQAELAAVRGRTAAALGLYEQALPAMEQAGALNLLCLATEFAARFHLATPGLARSGMALMRSAKQLYARWGATLKVSRLEAEFPQLHEAMETPTTALLNTARIESSRQMAADLDWTALMLTTQALSGEVHVDSLVARMMEALLALSGADYGVMLWLHDREWVVRAISPAGPEPLGQTLRQAGVAPERMVQAVALSRDALAAEAGDGSRMWEDPYFVRRRCASVLCTPIIRQNVLRGLIYLENRSVRGAFTLGRVDALKVVAAQAAISMDNAEVYQSLERRVEQRTSQLQAAQAQVLKLQRERVETQMAGGFAHEMRNALAGAALVLQQAHGAPQELSAEMLAHVQHCTERALRITEQTLKYAQLGASNLEATRVGLAPAIARAVSELQSGMREDALAVVVSVPPALAVNMPEEPLVGIVHHLLRNARDALQVNARESSLPSARTVTIEAAQQGGFVDIRVTDTGPGVIDSLRERLFEPFVSGKGSRGMGLGLAISRKQAQVYGGSLELEATGQGCTTFVVRVPAA